MSDADVSQVRLLALLDEHAESPYLEFVGDCDLSNRRDLVELATEVGALAARGGWIVIGVDDLGEVTGMLDETKAQKFDEAALRDQLRRYLPSSVEIRVARHRLPGGWTALIHVEANPAGAVVFAGDGAFDKEDGKQGIAFRAGDIFVRHGTKSERPSQDDVDQLARGAVERERLWLAELHRLEEAVMEIGRTARAEAVGAPDDRLRSIGQVTAVPAARQQLVSRLASVDRLGGPTFPQCRELAIGTIFVFYSQFTSAVYSAMNEIAQIAERGPM